MELNPLNDAPRSDAPRADDDGGSRLVSIINYEDDKRRHTLNIFRRYLDSGATEEILISWAGSYPDMTAAHIGALCAEPLTRRAAELDIEARQRGDMDEGEKTRKNENGEDDKVEDREEKVAPITAKCCRCLLPDAIASLLCCMPVTAIIDAHVQQTSLLKRVEERAHAHPDNATMAAAVAPRRRRVVYSQRLSCLAVFIVIGIYVFGILVVPSRSYGDWLPPDGGNWGNNFYDKDVCKDSCTGGATYFSGENQQCYRECHDPCSEGINNNNKSWANYSWALASECRECNEEIVGCMSCFECYTRDYGTSEYIHGKQYGYPRPVITYDQLASCLAEKERIAEREGYSEQYEPSCWGFFHWDPFTQHNRVCVHAATWMQVFGSVCLACSVVDVALRWAYIRVFNDWSNSFWSCFVRLYYLCKTVCMIILMVRWYNLHHILNPTINKTVWVFSPCPHIGVFFQFFGWAWLVTTCGVAAVSLIACCHLCCSDEQCSKGTGGSRPHSRAKARNKFNFNKLQKRLRAQRKRARRHRR
jgi:hypothetical protein